MKNSSRPSQQGVLCEDALREDLGFSAALLSGGDHRINIDPKTQLNIYGCSPGPRRQALQFSSSTASSISLRGLRAASAEYQLLLPAIGERNLLEIIDGRYTEFRTELASLLGVPNLDADIVFTPSGTDSQLIALFIAACMLAEDVATVIVASDQTGRGSLNAAAGQNFSEVTAKGVTVEKGRQVSRLFPSGYGIQIAIIDEEGNVLSDELIHQRIVESIEKLIRRGKKVVVHAMDCSKLGCRSPSSAVIAEITKKYQGMAQVIVDGCQARLSGARIQWYLDQGCLIVVTGSKFYTGPPFSGAVLVRKGGVSTVSARPEILERLVDYTCKVDWPQGCDGIRDALPATFNVGQLLRWAAALEEMRTYFAVPLYVRRKLLRDFCGTMERLIDQTSGLKRLRLPRRNVDSEIDQEMSDYTIFSFFIAEAGRYMSMEEATKVYQWLNMDVRDLLVRRTMIGDSDLGESICHIGQPVRVAYEPGKTAGALRISVDARLVYECWSKEGKRVDEARYRQVCGDVERVLKKVVLLAQNFVELCQLTICV